MPFRGKCNNAFCWRKNSPNWTHCADCNCGGNKDTSCFKTEPKIRTPLGPECATGLVQGLKRKIEGLKNEKKCGMKPIKKKQKDYYCLMLRKINGLDKKIQNVENLFISHLDHDSEYSLCAKEFPTRRFDYIDIYCAVRSLTNLANHIKEDILRTQNQNSYSNPEHLSKLYDKMKLLETELRSLSQYSEDCQNIRARKRVNDEENIGGSVTKKGYGFNNETTSSKKTGKETAKGYKRGSNPKCTENNNEYYDSQRSFQNLEEEDDYCAYCIARNVDHERRLSPSCNSCDGIKFHNKERLLDANEYSTIYYDNQNKDKQTALRNLSKGNRRNEERPYNPTSPSYSRCNICGDNMNGSKTIYKEPINKHRGEHKHHNIYTNNAEDAEFYSWPTTNNRNYNVFRPTNKRANFYKVHDGIEPSPNKCLLSQNNNNTYESEGPRRNKKPRRIRGKYKQNRARNSLSDLSDYECYRYDTQSQYASPRARAIELDRCCRQTTHNNRTNKHWKLVDQLEKNTDTSRNTIQLNQYKNVHTNRGYKEIKKHCNKDLHKAGYNVYYKNDEITTEKDHFKNKKQNYDYISDNIKTPKNNKYLRKNSSLKNNNDLIVRYTSSESEETLVLTNKNGKTTRNIKRAHIHVKLSDKMGIRGENENNNRLTDRADLFELDAHAFEYPQSNKNIRALNHNDHHITRAKHKSITEFPETSQHYFVKHEYDARDLELKPSMKTTGGADYFNQSSLSKPKVYFCKDSKCTNKINCGELIIRPNSNEPEFTESVISIIVDTLKDFNTNTCEKCTIRSQQFKVYPTNTKCRDRKNKILLNKTAIRCDDCKHNLEYRIRNLITDRQMYNYMKHNNTFKHRIVNDKKIIKNESDLTNLKALPLKESRLKFNREIEQNDGVLPVFQSNVNQNDLFEESASNNNFENNKSLEIPNAGNTININIHRGGSYSIQREPIDQLKAVNIPKINSFHLTELNSSANGHIANNKAKHNSGQININNYVQKNKETTSDKNTKSKNNTLGFQLHPEENVVTDNNVTPLTALNPKTYQVLTPMKSPFKARENSSINELKVYNTTRGENIIENERSKTSRSNTSINNNRDIEDIKNRKSSQIQPSIIEHIQIPSVEIDVPNKMTIKNDQNSNKIRKISKYPSQKFHRQCTLKSLKRGSNITSPTPSKSGPFGRSEGVLKHNFCGSQPTGNLAIERRSKNYNPGRRNSKTFKHRHTVYPRLPRFEVLTSNENRSSSCFKNMTIGINEHIKGRPFENITLTSESSFSVTNWKKIAENLKE